MHKKLLPALYFISLSLLFLTFSSCASRKDVAYFQASSPEKDSEHMDIAEKYVAAIQNGDILQITVSSLSAEASAMFNPYAQAKSSHSGSSASEDGYLVDPEGNITLPLIGKIQLNGLSTTKASDLITLKLEKFLQQPTVSLRILNYKISVMGEVNSPSVYTIPNQRITLPEAISMAGDLTINGLRNNILVIRESDGKRNFARVDLTKRDLFSSPYYYLHANDVVYVEPNKAKIASTDRSTQLVPIVMSGVSLLFVLINSLAN